MSADEPGQDDDGDGEDDDPEPFLMLPPKALDLEQGRLALFLGLILGHIVLL